MNIMSRIYYTEEEIKGIYIAHIDWIDEADHRKGYTIQTVKDHIYGVANMCRKSGRKIKLENMAYIIGLLHDMGKYAPEFQTHIRNSFFRNNQSDKVDHSTAGAKWLYENYGTNYNELSANTVNAELLVEIASNVILSHHSGLHNMIDPADSTNTFMNRIMKDKTDTNYTYYPVSVKNYFLEIDKAKLEQYIISASKEINNILIPYKAKEEKIVFFHIQSIERMLYSIMIDSDWLDTANWNEYSHNKQKENTFNDFNSLYNKLMSHYAKFPEAKDNINICRGKIAENCDNAGALMPGIYTLSVPTGAGKTLASMRFALAHAIKYNKNKIIGIVPYMSIIDQTVEEIKSILEDNDDEREIVYAHHSNVDYDYTSFIQKNSNSIRIYNDDDVRERSYVTQRWDAPIIFSTMVQFLDILFSYRKQAARRMQGLCNSIIIFDEIQSLPVDYTYMFNQAINFLAADCGCTIVLCTATQPCLNAPEMQEYAANIKGELEKNINSMFSAFNRVSVKADKTVRTIPEVAASIYKDSLNLDSILVIMNTTNSAKDMYNSLSNMIKPNTKLIYLSTKLCLTDRLIILKNIRKILDDNMHGKHHKIICVTTQLIEAGIDVSFNCVYRSLAGLASVAQAAGRCNRNGEMITKGLVNIFILNDEEEVVNRMPFVKRQQHVLLDMLYNMSDAEINNILIDKKYIDMYFKLFYNQTNSIQNAQISEHNLKYYIPRIGGYNTLYDLLSISSREKISINQKQRLLINIAFESAYSLSAVIKTEQMPVFVKLWETNTHNMVEYKKKSKDTGLSIIDECKLVYDIISNYAKDDTWKHKKWFKYFGKGGRKKFTKVLNKYVVNAYKYNINVLDENGLLDDTIYDIKVLNDSANYIDTGLIVKQEEIVNTFIAI